MTGGFGGHLLSLPSSRNVAIAFRRMNSMSIVGSGFSPGYVVPDDN